MTLTKTDLPHPLTLLWLTLAVFSASVFIIIPASLSASPSPRATAHTAQPQSKEMEESEQTYAALNMEEALEEWNSEDDVALHLLRQPQTRASVEWFYIAVTGSREITLAILDAADENNIPLSLAFALAYTESRYKTTAVHENKNQTIDRGLFQLNSASFPKLSEEEFFNPKTSANKGLGHLRFCLDTAGNEIAAIAMYNAGTNKVHSNRTPKSTLDYIAKIENYRAMLDGDFNEQVLSLYNTPNTDAPLLAKADFKPNPEL